MRLFVFNWHFVQNKAMIKEKIFSVKNRNKLHFVAYQKKGGSL